MNKSWFLYNFPSCKKSSVRQMNSPHRITLEFTSTTSSNPSLPAITTRNNFFQFFSRGNLEMRVALSLCWSCYVENTVGFVPQRDAADEIVTAWAAGFLIVVSPRPSVCLNFTRLGMKEVSGDLVGKNAREWHRSVD